MLRILDSHPNICCIRVDDNSYRNAFDIFQRYPVLSFTDAASVAVMINHNIRINFSFDSGFDSVSAIKRNEFV